MLQNCNEKFANLGFIPYICPCYGKARRGISRDCKGYAAHHARRNVVHPTDEQNGHEVRHQRGNAQKTAAHGLRQLFRAEYGRTPLQPLSDHILGRPGGARHVSHASVRAQAAHQGEGAHLSRLQPHLSRSKEEGQPRQNRQKARGCALARGSDQGTCRRGVSHKPHGLHLLRHRARPRQPLQPHHACELRQDGTPDD